MRASSWFPGFMIVLSSWAFSDAASTEGAGKTHALVKEMAVQAWPADGGPAVPKGLLFPAQDEARVTLLCLHGIQAHAAWFAPLARELTRAGVNVIAVDRRGSGINTEPPFVRGHTKGSEELLDDLQKQMHAAKAMGTSVYLLGTSWGSNLAAAYSLRELQPKPNGLILLVPATRSRFENWLTRPLAGLMSMIFPRLTKRLPFESSHYQAGDPQPPPQDQHQSPLKKPANGKAWRNDPGLASLLRQDEESGVLLTRPSYRLLHTGLGLAGEWKSSSKQLSVPFLMILAGRDQIMDNAAAWRAANQHFSNPRWTLLDDAGHGAQITHSSEIAEVILKWIHEAEDRPR